MFSLPLYFLSKKSLVNDKTVKWVAKTIVALCFRCLKQCKSYTLNPVRTCSFLPPQRARISSTNVITIRLLLKSLPNYGGVCLFFSPSTAFGPEDTSWDTDEGQSMRTAS